MLPTYRVDGPGGLSPEQIGEVLLQTAIYCGVPAANTAFAVAQRTLEEDANA
jgi:3-oxoadipate enol-lactonase / 4-carboxymuconolactone decarboxylase